MPLRHVVMFTWNEGFGAEQSERVRAGLDALPPQIEQIRGYVHGPDLGISGGNHDYALVADFDDAEAFAVYRDHPAHQQFIAEHITGKVAARGAVQFETP